jgi:transcriptional antiterminator RfaH
MPLLPLEPFVFPEDLLLAKKEIVPAEAATVDGALEPAADPVPEASPGRWWVLHTKPRAEKSLARRVLKQSLPFFLPLYKKQWRNRGRLFSSHVPLFPSYLFLHGDEQVRIHALETNLVVNCLTVGDQPRLWSDLARVYHLMAAGSPLSPEDRLIPGTTVEIISGPLAGLQGTIIRRGKQLRFFVEVQLLQRGVSVEIESWMFQPVGSPEPAETAR